MSEVVEKREPATGAEPAADAAEPESVDTESLTRSAGRGALWNIAGGGWTTLVRLGASTVLARVLFPEDFGIMGMAMLAQGMITRFGGLGMGTGVIAKKDVTEDDVSTAFWSTLAVKVFLFALAFAGAPLFAWFFETPELTWVLRVTCVGFLFAGLSAVSHTLIKKRLQFGRIVLIQGAGTLLQSGLAVVFAVVLEWDYWSLVISMVIGNGAMSLAYVVAAGWRPRLRFNRESFRFQFRYGINGLGSNILNYFRTNLDYLLVGKLLGSASLGLYEFAYRIPHMLHDRVSRPIGSVVFPVLAKAQSSDEKLASGYAKVSQYIALIVFPVLMILAALAQPTVAFLWGEKWLPIIVPLQILCFAACVRVCTGPLGSLWLCKNRPDMLTKLNAVSLLVALVAVGGFGYAYGVIGVAVGMLVASAPALVVTCLAFKYTNSSPLKWFSALAPPTLSGILAGAGAFALRLSLESAGIPAGPILAACIPAGVVVYALSLRLLFASEARDVLRTAKQIAFRQKPR
jgi:PST family polysaccharide transporter